MQLNWGSVSRSLWSPPFPPYLVRVYTLFPQRQQEVSKQSWDFRSDTFCNFQRRKFVRKKAQNRLYAFVVRFDPVQRWLRPCDNGIEIVNSVHMRAIFLSILALSYLHLKFVAYRQRNSFREVERFAKGHTAFNESGKRRKYFWLSVQYFLQPGPRAAFMIPQCLSSNTRL